LEAHGIDGEILQWIKNWLSDRKQRVVLTAEWADIRLERCSEWRPSGISLGPTPVVDLYK